MKSKKKKNKGINPHPLIEFTISMTSICNVNGEKNKDCKKEKKRERKQNPRVNSFISMIKILD